MYHEKNSDEIDHFKNFGNPKIFSILSQKSTYFLLSSPKISSTKTDFFSKNLRNLRPKIFEDSKILRLLEMG